MTEFEDIEDIDVDELKNSFISKGTHVIDCTVSDCGRFSYSKKESMKEYGLTETQYEFYKSVKKEL